MIEITGTATVTTLFETFDKGAPEIQLSHREEYWGERVLDAFGTIELHDQGEIKINRGVKTQDLFITELPKSPEFS